MCLYFPQAGRGLKSDFFGRHEWSVEVLYTQPVVPDLQGRRVLASASDRVRLREEMTSFAVVIDQIDDQKLLSDLLRDFLFVFAEDLALFQRKIISLKKGPPTGLYLVGFFQIQLIELLNKADVGTSEKRETMHPGSGNCLLLFVRKYNF